MAVTLGSGRLRRIAADDGLIRTFSQEYVRSDLGGRSLALTAQYALSAAPVLVAAAVLVRRLRHADLMSLLTALFGLHGVARDDVRELFRAAQDADLGSQVLGLILGVLFATGAAATLQRSLEVFWHVRKAPLRAMWRHLVWVCALVPFFTLSIRLATVTQKMTITPVVDALMAPVGLGIGSAIFFWWSQHFLLRGRIPWRALLPGSLLTGASLMVLSLLTQLIASSEIAEDVTNYGLVAASFALLVEVWLMSSVLLLATLIGAILHRRKHPDPSTITE